MRPCVKKINRPFFFAQGKDHLLGIDAHCPVQSGKHQDTHCAYVTACMHHYVLSEHCFGSFRPVYVHGAGQKHFFYT